MSERYRGIDDRVYVVTAYNPHPPHECTIHSYIDTHKHPDQPYELTLHLSRDQIRAKVTAKEWRPMKWVGLEWIDA